MADNDWKFKYGCSGSHMSSESHLSCGAGVGRPRQSRAGCWRISMSAPPASRCWPRSSPTSRSRRAPHSSLRVVSPTLALGRRPRGDERGGGGDHLARPRARHSPRARVASGSLPNERPNADRWLTRKGPSNAAALPVRAETRRRPRTRPETGHQDTGGAPRAPACGHVRPRAEYRVFGARRYASQHGRGRGHGGLAPSQHHPGHSPASFMSGSKPPGPQSRNHQIGSGATQVTAPSALSLGRVLEDLVAGLAALVRTDSEELTVPPPEQTCGGGGQTRRHQAPSTPSSTGGRFAQHPCSQLSADVRRPAGHLCTLERKAVHDRALAACT